MNWFIAKLYPYQIDHNSIRHPFMKSTMTNTSFEVAARNLNVKQSNIDSNLNSFFNPSLLPLFYWESKENSNKESDVRRIRKNRSNDHIAQDLCQWTTVLVDAGNDNHDDNGNKICLKKLNKRISQLVLSCHSCRQCIDVVRYIKIYTHTQMEREKSFNYNHKCQPQKTNKKSENWKIDNYK